MLLSQFLSTLPHLPLQFDRMSSAPVSCLPVNSKMSKAKKAIDEARDSQNRELDLVDKNVSSFDEMSGLRKCLPLCFGYLFAFCVVEIGPLLSESMDFDRKFTHIAYMTVTTHTHKNLRDFFCC